MSGPALHQLDSHHAIHSAANGEAEELTGMLRESIRREDRGVVKTLASILIEHWETRTLRHAHAEEEGFYLQILQQKPSLDQVIVALRRDHDLMRRIVEEVKEYMAGDSLDETVMARFEALLIINRIHGQEEERILLTPDADEGKEERL